LITPIHSGSLPHDFDVGGRGEIEMKTKQNNTYFFSFIFAFFSDEHTNR